MYNLEYLDIEENNRYEEVLNKVITKCFEEEGLLDSKLYISIILTNPENIQRINKKYRNIDKATDVLSFPMFEKSELIEKIKNKNFTHEDILGDIVISIEQVKKQAEEYGHAFERELAYMAVHGFYHLMGYDHILDEDKQKMREKEEKVLELLELKRS